MGNIITYLEEQNNLYQIQLPMANPQFDIQIGQWNLGFHHGVQHCKTYVRAMIHQWLLQLSYTNIIRTLYETVFNPLASQATESVLRQSDNINVNQNNSENKEDNPSTEAQVNSGDNKGKFLCWHYVSSYKDF